MKRFVRPIGAALGCIWFGLSACAMPGFTARAAAAEARAPLPSAVKVQVNDTPIDFPDMQPYLNEQGALIVPLLPAAEALGMSVEAEMASGSAYVAVRHGRGHRLDLFVGSPLSFADGLPDMLEQPVALQHGRVTVTLRAITRWSGLKLDWNGKQATAIVSTDGRKHKPAPQEAQKELILETADNYIGVPYVWGGTKPVGFDCSGFVQYVYRLHGVELPRTSREMYAIGDEVIELQPGDLVFFRTMGEATSHVGIYIGDNRFISATTSYGVHVARLNSTYWGPKYVGAKRVL